MNGWQCIWALFVSLADFSPGSFPGLVGGSTTPLTINIGALLDSDKHTRFFLQSVRDANAHQKEITLNGSAVLIQANPIRTAMHVCDRLVQGASPLHALLLLHPQGERQQGQEGLEASQYQLASAAASYTVGFYRIPIIGITSRESAFSDKNIHRSFVRMVPPYFHQADVWVRLLVDFGWRNVIVLTSANQNGRMLLGRFQNQADADDITIEKSLELEAGIENIADEIQSIVDLQSRVFLVYSEERESSTIFRQAASLGLTGAGHVWIVTEQALASIDCPIGALGLKLKHQHNAEDHIADTIHVVRQALQAAYKERPLSPPPQSCSSMAQPWADGPHFFQTILRQEVTGGRTGTVAFDDVGDRKTAEYQLINVQPGNRHTVVGECKSTAVSTSNIGCTLDRRKIIWPGQHRELPKGFIIPTHLKVYTLHEAPFTYVEPDSSESTCTGTFGGIICHPPGTNFTSSEKKALDNGNTAKPVVHCCWGFSIDLLKALASSLNFTYDLFLSSETRHVTSLDKQGVSSVNRSEQPTGILNELVVGDGDLAVAALTITPEHAKFVEFSKPFKYLGITILEKRPPKASTLNSFFQPFTNDLWVLVMVSLHLVAVSLYLLDRFSPFSRYRLSEHTEPEEDALNMSSAMWFAWGVLLNSGIGEGTPRSFGGRVLGMVWAGFAMIMVASYTANLAAFLVLDRPQSSLSGVNDARLRNPSENFTFATVRGSAVDLYFRRQVELATMYRIMEKHNYASAEQAVAAVKAEALKAFIWDSARLEYEAAKDKDCELVTAGELFGRSGYGVALRKNSPWTSKITLAILGFHETGFMEGLDNKYIYMRNETRCIGEENAPATLGLQNMAGVFFLVGMGIAGGIILIVIEITYKRQQVRRQRRERLARMVLDRWRRHVERKKKSRQKNLFQRANTSSARISLENMVDLDKSPQPRKKVTRGATVSAGL